MLEPPSAADPQHTLYLASQAKGYLARQKAWTLPYPLSLFLSNDSPEKWTIYDNLFRACLLAGHDATASQLLTELTARFGVSNHHVAAMRGLYSEATAANSDELGETIKLYDEILAEDPTLFALRKRRAALLKSVGKGADAIRDIVSLLDSSPTDAEAWMELAEMYVAMGNWEQAVFCLEEVVLVMPNAWNVQARFGEVLFLQAQAQTQAQTPQGTEEGRRAAVLAESLRRFCRSLELCDEYLRGCAGLKITAGKLIEALESGKKGGKGTGEEGELPLPSLETVKRLHEAATSQLSEIVRKASGGSREWDGYDDVEVQAARQLLESGAAKLER